MIDVLVMPFDDGEMLTTGTVGDAGIRYGSSVSDLTRAIDALDTEQLDRAHSAAVRLQTSCGWNRIAERHFELLEQVGTAKL